MALPSTRPRMRGADRREALLDVAAELVATLGPGAVTMERLAERAGVSKALPYRHFASADDALVALYRRETSALGVAVWRALSSAPPDADKVAVLAHAYFDALAPRRAVLVALSSPGSSVPAISDPDAEAVRFSVRVLRTFFGFPSGAEARLVAGMTQGAIVGAAGTLLSGAAPRSRVEPALVALLRPVLTP